VKPTQPGLSTAQQTAAISGDLDEMADEAVRVRAFSPLLEVTKDPVAAAQYFARRLTGRLECQPLPVEVVSHGRCRG